MKKTLLFAAVAAFLSLSAFTVKTAYDLKKSTAEVDQVEGVYIFTDSRPASEYEYVGTVQTGAISMGDSQYIGVRDRLIKKAKKDFPNADGLIFEFRSGKRDKVDAIKFK